MMRNPSPNPELRPNQGADCRVAPSAKPAARGNTKKAGKHGAKQGGKHGAQAKQAKRG